MFTAACFRPASGAQREPKTELVSFSSAVNWMQLSFQLQKVAVRSVSSRRTVGITLSYSSFSSPFPPKNVGLPKAHWTDPWDGPVRVPHTLVLKRPQAFPGGFLRTNSLCFRRRVLWFWKCAETTRRGVCFREMKMVLEMRKSHCKIKEGATQFVFWEICCWKGSGSSQLFFLLAYNWLIILYQFQV